MVIFFIILGILFFIILFFLLLYISRIELEIKTLELDTRNKQKEKLEKYFFVIRLKLLDKITWFKVEIDHKKIEKIKKSKIANSKIFSKFNNFGNIEKDFIKNRKEGIKYIKELKILIKKLNLYAEISIENPIATAYAVAGVASVISIFLAKFIREYRKEKYNYSIVPKYNISPYLKIKLNCIINVKMVHIINTIYMVLKKGSGKNDERTSNRRAYVCSHDKYPRYGRCKYNYR